MPDLTTPQVAITTPRVFRARTARDMQALAADGNATPVIGREFSRSERLLIRFDVYAAGTDAPKATATLLNRGGRQDHGSAGDAGGGGRVARHRRRPQHDSGWRVSDSDRRGRRQRHCASEVLRESTESADRSAAYAYIPRILVTLPTREMATM